MLSLLLLLLALYLVNNEECLTQIEDHILINHLKELHLSSKSCLKLGNRVESSQHFDLKWFLVLL